MEMRRCVSLIVVTALAMSVSVRGQRLTFTPSTLVDGTTSTLTVRCDVSATSKLYVIKILKGFISKIPLAIGDTDSMRVDTTIQQRATAAGSLNPPGSAYLALTFNAAISCNDAGDYKCEYTQEVETGTPMINQSLPAASNPGNMQLFVRPRLATYSVNESVELECAGDVGFPVVGSWRWETRDVNFASSWTPIRPSILQTDDPNTGTGCQRSGRSTLRFQVQQEDDDRMYRCSFRSDQYSSNFTFQVRATTGPGGSAPSTDNGGTSQANVGMIVGIVLGVLAAIAVVVVLIFFFVFKKKRDRASDYDTGEGKDGRTYPEEDLHGNPVYTLPNKDKYARENEAMESGGEEPPEFVEPEGRQEEQEEHEKKKQKPKSNPILSGLQSNQLFQRRSMKNKDSRDDRPSSRYGVDNEAMDGHVDGKDQDPGERHRSKPRRGHQDDPGSGEGRRHHRDRDRDRHGRDRDDGHYPSNHHYPSDPNEEPYPESRHYSSYEEDDGTDNRGYMPQEAIGSAV